jgi:hypothetical protein
MTYLGHIGLWSLALGGLSGWAMVLVIDKPEWLRRAGVRHPARVRQVHLDWILMGLILLAVDTAVDDIPEWIGAFIAFGTIVNPLGFVPLLFRADASDHGLYRFVITISFTALSVGLVALAVHASL